MFSAGKSVNSDASNALVQAVETEESILSAAPSPADSLGSRSSSHPLLLMLRASMIALVLAFEQVFTGLHINIDSCNSTLPIACFENKIIII